MKTSTIWIVLKEKDITCRHFGLVMHDISGLCKLFLNTYLTGIPPICPAQWSLPEHVDRCSDNLCFLNANCQLYPSPNANLPSSLCHSLKAFECQTLNIMWLHQSIWCVVVSEMIQWGVVEFQYWVPAGRRWAPIVPSPFVSLRSAAGWLASGFLVMSLKGRGVGAEDQSRSSNPCLCPASTQSDWA